MIFVFKFSSSGNPKAKPCSLCVGNKPVDSVYVGDNVSFSNTLLENGVMNAYNGYHYEDGSLNMSVGTTPGFKALSKIDYKANSSVTLTQSEIITIESNEHDSYLFTSHVTDSNNTFNPTVTFVKSGNYYYPSLTDLDTGFVHANGPWYGDENPPNRANIPSPVLIRTDSGNLINFYDSTDFTKEPVYWQECTQKVAFVYNLVPKRTYYYLVLNNGSVVTNIYNATSTYGILKTKGLFRNIRFTNIANTRDCGGWPTLDGTKLFRYDVLFRGLQLDYNKNGTVYGTDDVAINTPEDKLEFGKLGITYELDLRNASDRYNNYGTGNNVMTYTDRNGNSTKLVYKLNDGAVTAVGDYMEVYSDFTQFMFYLKALIDAIQSGGKAYMHCQQGKDRTGTLAALVEALCNVKDDGILKDYEITSFWGGQCSSRYHILHTNWDYKNRPTSASNISCAISNSRAETFRIFNNNVTGNTIQEKVLNWFLNNYAGTSYKIKDDNGNTISNALDALDYILDTLLEDAPLGYKYNIKSFAVLGDSQSAYKSDSRCPLRDLWWYRIAEHLGLDPIADVNNNSEGETKVARGKVSIADAGCSWGRINNLKVRGKDPDIIFVMMGGNDWGGRVPLGTYTAGDSLPVTASTTLANYSFKQAYALMLLRIHNKYPNSKIVCINQPLLTDTYVLDGSTQLMFADYMQALMDVTAQVNRQLGSTVCLTVDLYSAVHDLGDPIHNNLSTYISDSYVHLNAAGHELITDIIKQLWT